MMVIPHTKTLMLAIECILNLWKVLDQYIVIYISPTAVLYFKNVFILTLDISSFRCMLLQTVRFIV